DRALGLGVPAGVIQLLDRHDRDCAALATRLGVPHVVAPDTPAGSPFEVVPVMRWRHWTESALWWPERHTLGGADAVGTNPVFTGGVAALGVHMLLRLRPPRYLAALDPDRILVGHGAGLTGTGAAEELRDAISTSRRRLPGVLVRLPLAGRRV